MRTLSLLIRAASSLEAAVGQFRLRVQRDYTVVGEPSALWQGNLFGAADVLVTAYVKRKPKENHGFSYNKPATGG